MLVILYSLGCLSYRNFSSLRVLVNLVGDNAFLGIAAVGATFVILSGGIDLSVGAVVAFTSILIATLVTECKVPPLAAISIALILGALDGALMGCIIFWFEMPAFLVTLAGMFLARGLGFVVHSQSLGLRHRFFLEQINQDLAIPLNAQVSWPFTASCFVVIFIVAFICAHYTKFGRYVYALGGDEHSAGLMGLPVGRTKILIYTVSGFCSALAGVVYTFYTQAGDPATGSRSGTGRHRRRGDWRHPPQRRHRLHGRHRHGRADSRPNPDLIVFQGNLNTWWTRIVVGLLVLAFILLQNAISSASGRLGRIRPR